MRRRFTVVRLTVLMTLLTKLSSSCETTMCRGFKSISSTTVMTEWYCSGRTKILAPEDSSTAWPWLSKAFLTLASASPVRRASRKVLRVRSTSSRTTTSGTRRLCRMALLKGPLTAAARASASCTLASSAVSKSLATMLIPVTMDAPPEAAAEAARAAADSACSSSNRLLAMIASTSSDFSTRPIALCVLRFLTRLFNLPTPKDCNSSRRDSKCTC
mmetsp:Transcript_8966/g.16306  ORF Transcript_8966/g.16306 Transcript_8966/m.16306 type:complete len:216 (-) Transcript_8966:514-1161(-)